MILRLPSLADFSRQPGRGYFLLAQTLIVIFLLGDSLLVSPVYGISISALVHLFLVFLYFFTRLYGIKWFGIFAVVASIPLVLGTLLEWSATHWLSGSVI